MDYLLIIKDVLVCLFFCSLLFGSGFYGSRLLRKNKRYQLIFALIAAVFVGLFVLHLNYPWVKFGLFSFFYWWKLEYFFMAVVAVLAIIIRLPHCKRKIEKYMIFILGILLLLLAMLPFFSRPFMHILWANKKTVLKDGVVLQQSNYSCGAGSLATVLKHFQVPVTEADCVIALYIAPILGTEPDCVPAAVRQLSNNKLKAEVKQCSIEDLSKIKLPCMATVKHRGLIGHYICIMECNDDTVKIGDPLYGIKNISLDKLRNKWKNTVIEIIDNK